MKITFYKNCILTNKYADVFDVFKKDINNKTALDNYLELLEKLEIDLDDVYYTNSGRLNFDLEYVYSIYDYNYMKIEETGITTEEKPYSITRYCFIDDITIINGEVILSYSEDIWHSYAESLHIRHSLLSRKLILNYVEKDNIKEIKNYKLPIEYRTNSLPKIHSFGTTNKYCTIVIEYQTYQESKEGVVSRRDLGIGAIIVNEIIDGIKYSYDIQDSLSQISLTLSNLLLSSSTPNTFNDNENFDITNIYVLPYDITKLRTDKVFLSTQVVNKIKMVNQEGYFKLIPVELIFGKNSPVFEGELVNITNYRLPNKSEVLGENITFGTFSSQYEVNLINGDDSLVNLSFTINAYHLSLLLGIGNKYEDITKDFIINYPINIDSANVTHLKELSREYGQLNNTMQIISSSVGGVVSLFTGGALIGMGLPEMGTAQIGGGISSAVLGIGNAVINNDKLNEKMYVSSKPKPSLNNLALTNASFGICYISTNEPINYYEVLGTVHNEGYICSLYVEDILQGNNPENELYDVIKFEDVNLYGKFPQNICNKLKSILTNGIKIWYRAGVN